MVEREAVVKSRHGLHARPSAEISKYANSLHGTTVRIIDLENNTEADARSILTILSMEMLTNKRVKVVAEGIQEVEAAEYVAHVINTFDVEETMMPCDES